MRFFQTTNFLLFGMALAFASEVHAASYCLHRQTKNSFFPTVDELARCDVHEFGNLLNVGLTSGDAFWLSVDVGGIPRNLSLKLTDLQLDAVEVFAERSGNLQSLTKYDNPLIGALGLPLPEDPTVGKLHIRMVPKQYLSLKPQIGPTHLFSVQLSRVLAVKVVLISAVFVIAFLTIFGFAILRFSFMAYFGMYGTGMTLLLLNYSGLGSIYLWGSSDYVNELFFLLSHTVTAGCYYLFLMSFMGLKKLAPRVNVAFRAGTAFSAVASLVGAIDPSHSMVLVPVSGIVSCILITMAVLATFKNSSSSTKIYLLSSVIYLIFIALYMLNLFGISADYFMFGYELPLGSTVDMLMLLLAVAVKAKSIEDERQKERDAERRKMEQNHRLASLGLMAGGIAHEINNPLAIIKAMTSNLRFVIETGRNDRALLLDLSEKAESTVDRISSIVQSLRVLAGGTSGSSAPLNLHELHAAVLAVARERFDLNAVRMPHSGWSEDIHVNGNLVQLTQVFRNLVSNAFDVVRTDPEAWIRLDAFADETKIRFEVTNSGPAIDPKIAASMFDPFFTTKPIGTGMGMGLSICKALVQSLGGKIEIDLTREHTCFVVTLDRSPATPFQRRA